jgi:hypothetical protein
LYATSQQKSIRTELENEIPVILEEGTVSAAPRDVLWAPQVDVDAIAVLFDDFGGGEEVLGVVGAELDYQGPIGGWIALFAREGVEELIPVFFVGVREKLGKTVRASLATQIEGLLYLGVDHGRVN